MGSKERRHDRADVVRRGARALRPGPRPRGARRAEHGLEDVLRLPDGVRRRAQHADLPDLPGAARVDAGRQRDRGRVGDPDRAGAQLRDRRVVPVRPEELLLPGHAEELPDVPVRRADRLQRLDRRGRRRPRRPADGPRRHRACAHGGGHRQVAARRRRHRPDPRRRLLARRLQPGRHPPHRDRHQADPRYPRDRAARRQGVRRAAAGPAARPRRERRPDGAGLAALRREPLARAARHRRGGRWSSPHLGDAHRDQERELAAFGRAGGAVRGTAARRRTDVRPADPAGDPPLARGHRHHHLGAREVRRRGLPLLPGARPRAHGARQGLGRAAPRHAARAAARPTRAAPGGLGLHRPRDARHRRRRCARPGRADHRGRGHAGRPPASGGCPSSPGAPTSPRPTSRRSE